MSPAGSLPPSCKRSKRRSPICKIYSLASARRPYGSGTRIVTLKGVGEVTLTLEEPMRQAFRRALRLIVICATGVYGMGGGGRPVVDVAAEGLAGAEEKVHLRTMVVRSERQTDGLMTITVVHSERLGAIARETMGADVTPLLLNIAALAPEGARFDPRRIRVAQGGREWMPAVVGEERDLFSLDGQHAVSGLLAANEVRQVVLLLPEWFDISQPIVFSYGSSVKTLRFLGTEGTIASRR